MDHQRRRDGRARRPRRRGEASPVSSTSSRSADGAQASRTAPRTAWWPPAIATRMGSTRGVMGRRLLPVAHAVRVNEPSPCCHAIRTASTLVCTPSLARMFFTWLCTVSGLMPSSSASSVRGAALGEAGEDLAFATGEGGEPLGSRRQRARAPQPVHQAGQILGRQHELAGEARRKTSIRERSRWGGRRPHAPAARASVAASAPRSWTRRARARRARASRIALTISTPRPSTRSRSTSTRSARPSRTTLDRLRRVRDGTEDTDRPGGWASASRSPCVSSGSSSTTRTRICSITPDASAANGPQAEWGPAPVRRWDREDRSHDRASVEPPRGRDEPLPPPARAQPGGLVPLGRGGARDAPGTRTNPSSCRSATRPVTGVTSWSASRSRTRPRRRS